MLRKFFPHSKVFDPRNRPFCQDFYRQLGATAVSLGIGIAGFTVLLLMLHFELANTFPFAIACLATLIGLGHLAFSVGDLGDAYRRALAEAKTTTELDRLYTQPPQVLTAEITELQTQLDQLRQAVEECRDTLEHSRDELDTLKFQYHQESERQRRRIREAQQRLDKITDQLDRQQFASEIELRQQALAAQQAR